MFNRFFVVVLAFILTSGCSGVYYYLESGKMVYPQPNLRTFAYHGKTIEDTLVFFNEKKRKMSPVIKPDQTLLLINGKPYNGIIYIIGTPSQPPDSLNIELFEPNNEKKNLFSKFNFDGTIKVAEDNSIEKTDLIIESFDKMIIDNGRISSMYDNNILIYQKNEP